MTDTTTRQMAGRRGRIAALLVASTALTACAGVGDAPIFARDPDFQVARQWAAFGETEPALVDDGWLLTFNDPQLVSLVQEALLNNREIRASAARLAESRARARQVGAETLPTFGATAQVEASDGNNIDDDTDAEIGFGVAWEADLWGRIRAGQAAAALDAVAQSALYEAARQSIAAQVADTWFLIKGNRELLAIARSELGVFREGLRAVENQVDAGVVLGVDANIARARLAEAQDRVAEAEGDLIQSTRALEVLLGRYPSAELSASPGLGRLPGPVPPGLPSQLLERRPDVVAADRQVAAAFFRKRQAQAARLPRVTLNGDITSSGGSLAGALDGGNIVWTLAGNVIAPVFQFGQLKEEVNIQNARQAQALAEFGATALQAFQEVENAITNEQILGRRAGRLQSAVNQYREATEIEGQRYEAAEIDIIRLNEIQLDSFDAQRELTAVRTAQLRNRVQLHLALGGSFFEAAAPEVEVAVAVPDEAVE